MATTSPDNLRTPDPGDPYNLVADLATLSGDVQTALTLRANAFKGTASARTAYTATATNGMLWQDTDSIKMIWRKDGAVWVPAVWRWGGTTTQMSGFTQAPDGFEWANTTTNYVYVRVSGAWVSETVYAQAGAAGGPVLASGWTNLIGAPWSGVWAGRDGKVVTLGGAVTKSSYAPDEVIMTLPVGMRPQNTSVVFASYGTSPLYAYIQPNGAVTTTGGGVGQVTLGGAFQVA